MIRQLGLLIWLLIPLGGPAFASGDASFPRYKPSGNSPAPLDIRTNAYGASRTAPDALEIGARAPDFALPQAGGGTLSLADQRQAGPVVLIFYRGHW